MYKSLCVFFICFFFICCNKQESEHEDFYYRGEKYFSELDSANIDEYLGFNHEIENDIEMPRIRFSDNVLAIYDMFSVYVTTTRVSKTISRFHAKRTYSWQQ